VKRIPVRHPTGVFHPKNVLLVEDAEPSEDAGEPERFWLPRRRRI
jgi:hypothetical protein